MVDVDVLAWVRQQCGDYRYDLGGVFRARGDTEWPLTAQGPAELEAKLRKGGHILPLPKEPAALANVLEVSIVDFLLARIESAGDGLSARRGGERFYPDLEVSQSEDGPHYAVDVKVARRRVTKGGRTTRQTQSRITLYTGNTYFKFPEVHWPGTFRPFADYAQHLDVLGIYTLNPEATGRVDDLELIVHET